MTIIFKFISLLGLLLTIIPAFLVFAGRMELQQHYLYMLFGTVVWFLSAPFWMLKKKGT